MGPPGVLELGARSVKRSPEELLEAYTDANHDLIGALATIKHLAQNAVDGIAPLDPQHVLDIASGRIERAYETIG